MHTQRGIMRCGGRACYLLVVGVLVPCSPPHPPPLPPPLSGFKSPPDQVRNWGQNHTGWSGCALFGPGSSKGSFARVIRWKAGGLAGGQGRGVAQSVFLGVSVGRARSPTSASARSLHCAPKWALGREEEVGLVWQSRKTRWLARTGLVECPKGDTPAPTSRKRAARTRTQKEPSPALRPDRGGTDSKPPDALPSPLAR